MEGQIQSSPKLGSPSENDDVKYVSGLSTVLVATIQEAKDRIAQIEYIFCNQLYPNFKSKSKLLRKIYSEAKRASDGEWKVKMESLELEKQRALEELARVEARGKTRFGELESDLRKKSKEVDEGLKLHSDLVQLLEMKLSAIVEKDKKLRENEETKNVLEKKVKALQEAIRVKSEEVVKGNELTENLLKKIESRDLEIANSENEGEKEKRVLLEKLNEGAELYQKTLEDIESKNAELRTEKRKRKEVIEAFKRLKSQYDFMCSQSGLSKENMISPYKSQEDSDSFPNLEEQKDISPASNDKSKTKGKTIVNKPLEDEKRGQSSTNNNIQITLPDREERDQDISPASNDKLITKTKTIINKTSNIKKQGQASTHTKDQDISPALNDKSKAKSKTIINKTLNIEKQGQSSTIVGTKRLASLFWRDTRAHQGKNGQDPHDDFLDTPLENARGNIARAAARGDARPIGDTSDDDETQDVSDHPQIKMMKKNPTVVISTAKEGGERGGFKYIESVRKKAERENLKGVECKQCKKFYDAVLCGEEGRDGNFSARCEHHEGVSRHRYKYVPPSTPEGFWNIGFESEM